jgi:hypothetical protein
MGLIPQMYIFDFLKSISSMNLPAAFGQADDQFSRHRRPRAIGDKHHSWRTGSFEMLNCVAFRGAKIVLLTSQRDC